MKTKRITFLSILVLLSTLIACKSSHDKSTKTNIPLEKYEILVDGMTCTGCEQTIQTAVSGLEGVEKVTASHEKGIAVVEIQEGMFDSLAIKSKITESGYTVTGFKNLAQ